MSQVAIAADQFFNTLTWAKADVTGSFITGFGYSDETLSARAWRLRDSSRNWRYFRAIVDMIFLVLFRDKDHCQSSYESEMHRKHLPKTYSE